MQPSDIESQQHIYTVSQLNKEVRTELENAFPYVWVEGEISNFSAPNSGHWYFSLKDATAQVRSCMFRGMQRKLPFTPKDGLHILVRARVSMYENRGEFQLIVEHMEERGEGKLRRAYELLKQKLAAAGLFSDAHKKPIPTFPKQIGIITSATGAAIRDILTVLKRRHAAVNIIIYPTLVQGATAAPTIAKAIQIANRRNECDVLIVTRGGGSLEDLWPFNEEIVAHAIYESVIPVISAVGHEVDFTIADFVADIRAPTPSAAAELATPNQAELAQRLLRANQQITRHMRQQLQRYADQMKWMQKNLAQQHPKRRLAEQMQRLDFCELGLVKWQNQLIHRLLQRTKDLDHRLHRLTPQNKITAEVNKTNVYRQQLITLTTATISKYQTMLGNTAATLDALSPLATLKRGYAIATKDKSVLRETNQIKIGDHIQVRLMNGELICQVEKIHE